LHPPFARRAGTGRVSDFGFTEIIHHTTMSFFRRVPWAGRTGLEVGSPIWCVLSIGLLLILAGAAVDTGYHIWWSRQSQLRDVGLAGHLVTLAGMVVTMVGVFAVGLRRPAPSGSVKGEFDAVGRRASTS
jgi:hypothetical protein